MANEKRLIDANDALERLKKAEKEMMVVTMMGCKAVPMDGVIDFVASRPTVDAVEVVHGEWSTIEDDYCGLTALQCSECNQEYWFEDEPPMKIYKYCPNCGAKMDIEKE